MPYIRGLITGGTIRNITVKKVYNIRGNVFALNSVWEESKKTQAM